MGDGSPGCHFVYFIGCTYPVSFDACNEVPTLGATPEATSSSLTTALLSLSFDLSEQIFIQTSKSQDRLANALVGQTQQAQSTGLEPRALQLVWLDVTWLQTTHVDQNP